MEKVLSGHRDILAGGELPHHEQAIEMPSSKSSSASCATSHVAMLHVLADHRCMHGRAIFSISAKRVGTAL